MSGVKEFFGGSTGLNSDLIFNDVRRIYILLYKTLSRTVFHELKPNGTTVKRMTAPSTEWIVYNPFTDKILGSDGVSLSLFDGRGTLIKQLQYPSPSPNSPQNFGVAESNGERFFVVVDQSLQTSATYLFRL